MAPDKARLRVVEDARPEGDVVGRIEDNVLHVGRRRMLQAMWRDEENGGMENGEVVVVVWWRK